MSLELTEALRQTIRAADLMAESIGSMVATCEEGNALEISEEGIAAGRSMLLGWARMRAGVSALLEDDDGE